MNSLDVAIAFLYFVNFDLAFKTAAAPGKYDADNSESLTKPLVQNNINPEEQKVQKHI